MLQSISLERNRSDRELFFGFTAYNPVEILASGSYPSGKGIPEFRSDGVRWNREFCQIVRQLLPGQKPGSIRFLKTGGIQ